MQGMQITISGRIVGRLLLGVLVLAGLAGAVWVASLLLAEGDPVGGQVVPDRYQAVFLEDGQVLFGRLREARDGYFELVDAFVIQEVPGEEDAPPTQELRSVRDALHEPDGNVLLRREHVVRIDNLAPDAEVAATMDRLREERS